MNRAIKAAVDRHIEKFGEFNATIMGVSFSNETSQRILDGINQAIEIGVPVSNESLGISYPPGVKV